MSPSPGIGSSADAARPGAAAWGLGRANSWRLLGGFSPAAQGVPAQSSARARGSRAAAGARGVRQGSAPSRREATRRGWWFIPTHHCTQVLETLKK